MITINRDPEFVKNLVSTIQVEKDLWQEALNAIDAHDAHKMRSLVLKGLDINWRSPITGHSDETLLMIAASEESNSELVQALIELGADVNAEAHCGTALTRAKGYRTIKLLLDHGANPNVPTKTDRGTALLYHAEHGNADIVKLLIEHGADIHTDWDRIDVFNTALSNGHSNVIDVLIEALRKKAEQNEINWSKLNWFDIAIDNGDNNLINRLFSIVVKDRESANSALNAALDSGNFELVMKLLKHGATLDEYAVNADYLTEAARKGDMKAVTFFLKHGVNIDEEDSYGSTALTNAVAVGHLDLVNVLLKKGASVNIVNQRLRYDTTPLMTSLWQLDKNSYDDEAKETYLKIIEALLKAGADPNLIVEGYDSDGMHYSNSAYTLAPHLAKGCENEVMGLFDKYSRKKKSKWSLFGILKRKK